MRGTAALLLLLAMLATAGCSLTPNRDADLLAPVTRAGNEYVRARERYQDDPAIVELYRNRLVELALTLAQHRRQEGDWYAAERTLQGALEYLPGHPRLEQAREETAGRRREQLQATRDRALADEAAYLLARQAGLREQARLAPTGYLDDWQRSRLESRINDLAEPLRNCARRHLEREDLALAQRCLELAERIRDRAFVQETRQALQSRLAPPQPATPPAPATPKATSPPRNSDHDRDRRQREAGLRSQLTRAMNAGDLSRARRITRELIELKGETPRLRDLQRSLDTAIQVQIDSLHQLASEHYRSQRYREARAAWEEVLKLDPRDPQAQALIERAERVIQKLESLHQEDNRPPSSP